MQQVKLFKSIESDVHILEDEINAWLRDSGARVVHMFGNISPQTVTSDASKGTRAFAPSDIFMAVVYEQG